MRVQLVFQVWLDKKHKPVAYFSEEGLELSAGDFHADAMFEAEIELDEDAAADLWAALAKGYRPVFRALAVDPDSWRTTGNESDQKGE